MKKIKNFSIFMIVLCTALFFIGCEDHVKNSRNTANVSITLSSESNGRTIRPTELTKPGFYKIELLQGQVVKYEGSSESNTISIDNVVLGDYDVKAYGYKSPSELILLSNAESKINVKPSGNNAAEIQLQAITTGDGLKGYIEVTFDWTEMLSNSTNELFKKAISSYDTTIKLVDKKTSGVKGTLPVEKNSTGAIFKAELPVSTGFEGNFIISYTLKGTEYLLANLETEEIQIFSGETSKKTYKLTSKNTIDYSSAPNITLTYGEEEPSTSIKASWDIKDINGGLLYKSITLSIRENGKALIEPVTITYENEPYQNTHTFSGLVSGTEYTITAKAITSGNTETAEIEATYRPKVFVKSVSIDESTIKAPISVGETIALSGNIFPDNTTYKEGKWSLEDGSILSIDNADSTLPSTVNLTALKPGQTKLILTAKEMNINGEAVSATTTKYIQVKLAQPTTPTAKAVSTNAPYSINVTWDVPTDADSVDLYRKDTTAGEMVLIKNFPSTESSYTDESNLKTNHNYSYAIVAKSNVGDYATSVQSKESNVIVPNAPALTLNDAILTPEQEIAFSSSEFNLEKGFYVTREKGATISFDSNIGFEGASNFQWAINGTRVGEVTQTPQPITITYQQKEIKLNPQYPNTLTLFCEKDGLKYSGSLYFRYLNVVDTGVDLKINGGTEAKIDNLESGVKLAASVLPTNADLKTITFTSSNTEIATVDGNGNIKFHPSNTGDVTITATPTYGTAASVTLHVESGAKKLLNETIPYIQEQLIYANKKWEGDWAAYDAFSVSTESFEINDINFNGNNNRYSSIGSKITRMHGAPAGFKDFNSVKQVFSFIANNEIYQQLDIKTTEDIQTMVTNGEGSGSIGIDPLKNIGEGNKGIIRVTPSNKNYYATIQFKSINIENDSSRSGSFLVTVLENNTSTQLAQEEIAYDQTLNSLYIK